MYFLKHVTFPREEAVIYLQREKDEDALLDFITTSFVFSETETENNLKKKDPDTDEGSLDAEEDEDNNYCHRDSPHPGPRT